MIKVSLKRIVVCSILCGMVISSLIAFSINSSNSFNYPIILKPSQTFDESISENLPKITSDSNSSIEMLIIAPNDPEFINALVPLMEWKNLKGVKTIILSNFTEYEGIDGPQKIRNVIIEYYNRENIKWVLLAGDAQSNLIPIRYVYNPDVVEHGGHETVGNPEYKPTDYYYADLTGSWDEDGDGLWGESAEKNENGIDEIDWYPEVYVGRFPASTAEELRIMVEKSLTYEKNPTIGEWMNNMLLAGGISDTVNQEPPDGEDESRLTDYIIQNYVTGKMDYTHLWRSASYIPADPKFPLSHNNFVNELNSGHSAVLFAGHGTFSQYTDKAGTIYTSSDAASVANANMPSLIYADACSTSSYDLDSYDNNIGETLMKKNNSGAIAYVGGLRVTWYFTNDTLLEKLNRGNAKLFWKEFFENQKYQPGLALYDSKVAYMNSEYFTSQSSINYEYQRKQLLTYNLLGDPELDVYTAVPKSVRNPLPSIIYSGQNLTLTIMDVEGNPVSNVRVNVRSNDNIYVTKYTDDQGNAYIKLPLGVNIKMNLTITGHNVVPLTTTFTTAPDPTNPTVLSASRNPVNPTSRDNILFQVQAYDLESGIESVLLQLQSTSGISYVNLKLNETTNLFESRLNKLPPGSYEYSIIVRDNSGNLSTLSNEGYLFTIPLPFIDILLVIFLFGTIFILSYYLIKGFSLSKEFKHTLKL